MENTPSAPRSPSSLQLTATVPLLNYPWRTNLFTYHGPDDTTLSERLRAHLCGNGLQELSNNNLLSALAARVDSFTPSLSQTAVRKSLGLADQRAMTGDGYALTGWVGGRFVDAFVSCAALDRIVAALQMGPLVPPRQSRHPSATDTPPPDSEPTDYKEHWKNLALLSLAYNVERQTSDKDAWFRPEKLESNDASYVAILLATGSTCKEKSHMNAVASNIFVLAIILLALSKRKKKSFINEIKEMISMCVLNEDILKGIDSFFHETLTFRKLHNVYAAITGSILDILNPGWQFNQAPSQAKPRDRIQDYMRRTGQVLETIPTGIIAAERELWNLVFTLAQRQSHAFSQANPGAAQLAYKQLEAALLQTLHDGLGRVVNAIILPSSLTLLTIERVPSPMFLEWPPLAEEASAPSHDDSASEDDAEIPWQASKRSRSPNANTDGANNVSTKRLKMEMDSVRSTRQCETHIAALDGARETNQMLQYTGYGREPPTSPPASEHDELELKMEVQAEVPQEQELLNNPVEIRTFCNLQEIQDAKKVEAIMHIKRQKLRKLLSRTAMEHLPALFSTSRTTVVEQHTLNVNTFVSDNRGNLMSQIKRFSIRWPSGTPDNFTSWHALAVHAGLFEVSQPNTTGSGCVVYTECTLHQLFPQQLCRLFGEKDLHVVPAKEAGRDFSAQTLCELELDLHIKRLIYENQHLSPSDSGKRLGSLHQLFSLPPDDTRRMEINCFDLPLSHNFAQMPLLVRRMSVVHKALSTESQLHPHWDFLGWGFVSTARANSKATFYAGRHATWIQVISGAMVFFIRDDETSAMPAQPAVLTPTEHKWIPTVLLPGHKLFLRPGREHIICTLEDTIAQGGHFFTHATLHRSFEAGIRDAMYGSSMTLKKTYSTTETLLQRLLSSYFADFVSSLQQQVEVPFPCDDNLAALLVMNLYPELFMPKPLNEVKENEQDREWADKRDKDRNAAHEQAVIIMAHDAKLVTSVQLLAKRLNGLMHYWHRCLIGKQTDTCCDSA